MHRNDLSISPPENGDFLYTRLQEKSLEELQAWSGQIWTDYNAHDPGVTLMDVLNNALTEWQYKLQFPLTDYLSGGHEAPTYEAMGLFPPEQVFPTSPVTADDYRRLILNQLPEVENAWIYTHGGNTAHLPAKEIPGHLSTPPAGSYTILVKRSPYSSEDEEKLRAKIFRLYHGNRNLCENLYEIRFTCGRELFLHADAEITSNADPATLLAHLFREARSRVSGSFHSLNAEERKSRGMPMDEWMDGPEEDGARLDLSGSGEPHTETLLYGNLRTLPGIVRLYSCHLEDTEGNVVNIFEDNDTLNIPDSPDNLHVSLNRNGMDVPVKFEIFQKTLQPFLHTVRDNRWMYRESEKEYEEPQSGMHPGLYSHYSVKNDFPPCYGVGKAGLPARAGKEEQQRIRQWEGYLDLFDLVFQQGLKELANIPSLMTLNAASRQPELKTEPSDARHDSERGRPVVRQKNFLLDCLDALYGETSSPSWMQEYDYYRESADDRRKARVRFLKGVPRWGRNRSRACDITAGQSEANIPGIKDYVSTLLGWHTNEEAAVTNLMPAYNLRLKSEEKGFSGYSGGAHTELITTDLMNSCCSEPVKEWNLTYEEAHYEELRQALPILYDNVMEDGLLRGGVTMGNYRLASPFTGLWLLVFHNREKETWMTLGRSRDKEKLTRLCNYLHCFLTRLNRESEVMYVVEHQWFSPPEPLSLTIVLSGWTARMKDEGFRRRCRELIGDRIPAHLTLRFCWLPFGKMRTFETHWREWRRAQRLSPAIPLEIAAKAMNSIQNLLKEESQASVTLKTPPSGPKP